MYMNGVFLSIAYITCQLRAYYVSIQQFIFTSRITITKLMSNILEARVKKKHNRIGRRREFFFIHLFMHCVVFDYQVKHVTSSERSMSRLFFSHPFFYFCYVCICLYIFMDVYSKWINVWCKN